MRCFAGEHIHCYDERFLDVQLSLETDLRGHADSVMYLRWHPKNQDRLASISASEQSIRFWDVRSGKSTATLSTPGHNLYLAWNHDGNSMVVGNREDGMCKIMPCALMFNKNILCLQSNSGSICHVMQSYARLTLEK